MDNGGELAATLSRLYDYFDRQLQNSNTTKTQDGIDEVLGLLTELRNSWHQMLNSQEEPKGASRQERIFQPRTSPCLIGAEMPFEFFSVLKPRIQ